MELLDCYRAVRLPAVELWGCRTGLPQTRGAAVELWGCHRAVGLRSYGAAVKLGDCRGNSRSIAGLVTRSKTRADVAVSHMQ